MATAILGAFQRTNLDDHNDILKHSNETLKTSKNDTTALHEKAVALLNLNRFEDAVKLFEQADSSLKDIAPLEHAYALYKSGDFEQARKVAHGVDHRGARHLEAQASYRLEDFSHAVELYKSLVTEVDAQEENDLRINTGATDAQLEWRRLGNFVTKKRAGREDLEAFETAYNAACGCIARGELGQGEVLLKRAKDLCNASEDLSDSEKASELLPISVQQLYVASILGKVDQAEMLAQEITVEDIPDASTKYIAETNMLVHSSKSANPYLIHRAMTSKQSLPKTDHLFEYQEGIKQQNKAAAEMLASKYAGVANSTGKFLANKTPTTSPSINALSVVNAAATAQNQLGPLGLKTLLPLLEKRPVDVGLVMTIVQLYMLMKNHGAAIRMVEAFFKRLEDHSSSHNMDVRYAPGLVAMLVSLYSVEGRRFHIKAELAKAANHWRHKSKPSLGLLQAAGLSLLDAGDDEQAGAIFESLRSQYPKDRFALAGHVAAVAGQESSDLKAEADQLTAVERLIQGVDVAALEADGIPQTVSTATILSKKRASESENKAKKKRVRKSRLPQDYDPSKPADPERWLPLRDRSSYKPKGKKGKQKALTQTQGGVSDKASESLNISDGVSKPSTTVMTGSSGGGKTKKKKSKK